MVAGGGLRGGCGVGFGVGVGVGLGGWLAVVVLGCVSGGAGVCFTCVFFSFYVAPNIVKYFQDYFPKCKQTLKKQSFSLRSFSFANILRWRMFYVETNGARILAKEIEKRV